VLGRDAEPELPGPKKIKRPNLAISNFKEAKFPSKKLLK